jgi:SPX domain protein involved in polyphosphate accumulation
MLRHILNVNTPASGIDQKWERIERKFFVSPEKTFLVRNLLSQTCLKDKLYYRGIVNSLYFDTPDLDHYWKSDDGDYGRHKIRIRWYDSPPDACRTFPV